MSTPNKKMEIEKTQLYNLLSRKLKLNFMQEKKNKLIVGLRT